MPGMNMMNNPHPDDQEAAMARADLYKMANYSFKLFKMIKDGDQLEGWVQAKITKSADYIASVYHYLEYEMKFSEYGNKIENSDMYTEDVRKQFQRKLTEAKIKLNKLKKKNEKDLDEAFDDKAKVGDTKKTRTGELTKTDKGVVHKNTSYKDDGEAEEKSGKGVKSHAKTQSAADKKNRSPALKQSPKSAKTWGMKDSAKFDNRDKEVKEGSIQGGVWTADAPKKGAPNVPVPSPNEGPTSGSLKPGQPGYAAQMLKNKQAPKVSADPSKRGVTPGSSKRTAGADTMEGKKPDFLDMDKDGDKKEPMKKAVADKKAGPKKGVNPFAKVKETAISGAPQKSGIPATAKTTVPGMRATPQDLKKAGASAVLGEGKCNHTAKGKSCPVHGLKECGSGMYEASIKR